MAGALLVVLGGSRVALGASEPAETPPRRAARVDSLTVTALDTVPAQLEVELAGSLADTCSHIEIVEETSRLDANRIELFVESLRVPREACAEGLAPYRLRLFLDVSALAEGDYVVEANGQEAVFTIEPVGDFPVMSLGLFESDSRVIVPAAGLALVGPGDWTRSGLTWTSPPFWAARIGLRWHPAEVSPVDLLPPESTLLESSQSRLGWEVGVRYRVTRDDETVWSEHLFVACSASTLCEFWMEAPSDPLLDAAGESFWRMVRFAVRVTTELVEGET